MYIIFAKVLEIKLRLRLALVEKCKFFYYLTYFDYYSWVLLHFLVLFMGPTILFLLDFSFIYSIFSKKFLVSIK